jgi:outer membrane protein
MMTNSNHWGVIRATCTAALIVSASAPAAAQEQGSTEKNPRDLIITIGGGAQFYPRYPGADGSDLFPMPIINWRHAGEPVEFEASDEGTGIGLLNGDSPINFGPAIQFQSSRRNKDVGAPVGKVGFTVEAGAFVQAWIGRNVRLRAEGRRGVGGHEAWVGDVSADLVARDGDRTVFGIGPRVRLSSGRYQRAYFGVTPAVAVATGLASYRPGGGVHAVGIASSVTHQLSEKWGVHAYAGYDRLVGDAADSPLVRRYGSRDQLSGGLGLTYSFRIRRGRN